MKGEKTVSEVLASGTNIPISLLSGFFQGSFEVRENGVYSVAAQDSDGRQGVKTIEITNIDRTPPAPVTGLTATYSAVDKKITVNWTNPLDEDFEELTLRWKKGGSKGKAAGTCRDYRHQPEPYPL